MIRNQNPLPSLIQNQKLNLRQNLQNKNLLHQTFQIDSKLKLLKVINLNPLLNNLNLSWQILLTNLKWMKMMKMTMMKDLVLKSKKTQNLNHLLLLMILLHLYPKILTVILWMIQMIKKAHSLNLELMILINLHIKIHLMNY